MVERTPEFFLKFRNQFRFLGPFTEPKTWGKWFKAPIEKPCDYLCLKLFDKVGRVPESAISFILQTYNC